MRLMASKPEAFHHDAVVKDNYIMGTCRALVLSRWQDIEVTGNTFWATDFLTEVSSAASGSGIAENPPRPELKNYRVDRNTYFDNGKPRPFIYSAHENALDEEQLSFSQWQALGLDQRSQMLPGKAGRPTGTKVFVFPNKFEKGRGYRSRRPCPFAARKTPPALLACGVFSAAQGHPRTGPWASPSGARDGQRSALKLPGASPAEVERRAPRVLTRTRSGASVASGGADELAPVSPAEADRHGLARSQGSRP